VVVEDLVVGHGVSGSPGLASYHQTSQEPDPSEDPSTHQSPSGDRCPNRLGYVMLDYASGTYRPARCQRLACPYCVRSEAMIRAAAIWLAKPRRAIRVSLVADPGDPDPWPTVRYRMNKLREHYGRLVGDLGEWCYSVEPNPRGTGYHAHAWQHGPGKVDAQALDECAARAGAGFCKVETVHHAGQASQYGLKALRGSGYALKGTDDDADTFLRVNGGRLTHQSRGFFRSEAGVRLPVRRAEELALSALFGEREPGRWALVSEDAARSFLSVPRKSGPASVTLTRDGCSPAQLVEPSRSSSRSSEVA
jgi:hypothetical protein